jgi:hypothetical protein
MEKPMPSNALVDSARRCAHDDSVQEFIRTRGITRCPTACLVPTQAVIADTDRIALTAHAAARERLREMRAAATATLGLPWFAPH